VLWFRELSIALPTAVQAESDEHDTALSACDGTEGGAGVDWIDQLEPSQRSISVRLVSEATSR
jgi:hypothetical protein